VSLAWRLWKSVLRLAVRENSFSGRVVRRQRVPVFEGHRLPSTGSGRNIRKVSCRGKACLFGVIRVAVLEKCFEACA
jgi:hypothetical protein